MHSEVKRPSFLMANLELKFPLWKCEKWNHLEASFTEGKEIGRKRFYEKMTPPDDAKNNLTSWSVASHWKYFCFCWDFWSLNTRAAGLPNRDFYERSNQLISFSYYMQHIVWISRNSNWIIHPDLNYKLTKFNYDQTHLTTIEA